MSELREQFATPALPDPSRPVPTFPHGSPSTPPSSTSTRDTTPVDEPRRLHRGADAPPTHDHPSSSDRPGQDAGSPVDDRGAGGPVAGGQSGLCQMVEVDGEMVRVQGGSTPMTDADRAALAEVVRAARVKLGEMPPGPLSVACPLCGSGVGEFCRRVETGRMTGVHSERRDFLAAADGAQ